jgi:hypothetical protein
VQSVDSYQKPFEIEIHRQEINGLQESVGALLSAKEIKEAEVQRIQKRLEALEAIYPEFPERN